MPHHNTIFSQILKLVPRHEFSRLSGKQDSVSRSNIEPTIGHLKSDYRLNRNHFKGETGDKINALLSAATYNFAKLLA